MSINLHRLSARRAIHDAYACQLGSKPFEPTTTHGTRDISSSLICNAIEAGKVIAVVEALPPVLRDWAVWSYGPRGEKFELPAQAGLFAWLVDHVNSAIAASDKDYRPGTAKKIRDVVAYTIINHRHHALTERDIYPVKVIKKLCGIQHANWQRDFQRWWVWAGDVAEALDRQSLPPLGKLLGIVSDEVEQDTGYAVQQTKGSLAYIEQFTSQQRQALS